MCVCNPVCADGALVCALCGVAFSIGTQYVHTPIVDKYGRFFPHASRLRYNRARRFSRIIANTYGHRVPVLDAKLYPHLLPCTDIQSVFRVIRSLEARWAKRYTMYRPSKNVALDIVVFTIPANKTGNTFFNINTHGSAKIAH